MATGLGVTRDRKRFFVVEFHVDECVPPPVPAAGKFTGDLPTPTRKCCRMFEFAVDVSVLFDAGKPTGHPPTPFFK